MFVRVKFTNKKHPEDLLCYSINCSGFKLRINLADFSQVVLAWNYLQNLLLESPVVFYLKIKSIDKTEPLLASKSVVPAEISPRSRQEFGGLGYHFEPQDETNTRFSDGEQFTIYLYSNRSNFTFIPDRIELLQFIKDATEVLSKNGVRAGRVSDSDARINNYFSLRFDGTISEWDHSLPATDYFHISNKTHLAEGREGFPVGYIQYTTPGSPEHRLSLAFVDYLRSGDMNFLIRRNTYLNYKAINMSILDYKFRKGFLEKDKKKFTIFNLGLFRTEDLIKPALETKRILTSQIPMDNSEHARNFEPKFYYKPPTYTPETLQRADEHFTRSSMS